MSKRVALAAALAGLVLGTGAVIWLGAGHILQAIFKIGWLGLVYVVAWQLAVFIALGAAWWIVSPGAGLLTVIWGRLVREGGETCLPFSEIGGLVFGARAIMLRGVRLPLAAASSIADVLCEAMGLVPFFLLGLAMLLTRDPHSALAWPMAAGLGLLLAGGAALFLLRRRLSPLLRRGTARLLARWSKEAPRQVQHIQSRFDALMQRRGRLAGGAATHFLCWCGGGGNVWIAYHLLGAHPSLADALAIESLLSAVLAVGFFVPGGLGVQELTYIGVGRVFGMPAHLSLALSLIRRARDIIIGAPALLLWQALEARQLKTRKGTATHAD